MWFFLALLAVAGSIARASITAGVRVIALGNNNSNFDTPHVSVATGVAGSHSYWCSVVDEDNNDKVYATVVQGTFNTSYPNTPWAGTFMSNSEVRITSSLLGTNNPCTAVQGTTTATVSGSVDANELAGAVQVATRTASASFDYVFVVSIGN
jgi:hypothetical protein